MFIMRFPLLIGLIFIAAVVLCGCLSSSPDPTGTSTGSTAGSGVVRVDALLDLTGVGSSLGESSQAALLTAQDDINQYYGGIGSPARVEIVVHDAGSDPSTALALAGEVHATGRKFVIGYLGSAEVSAIKNYTDMNGMIAISSGSTAPSLAIPNDSVYRMISDDSAQGEFMAAYLDSEKVHAVIPIWRGDVWGDSLSNLTVSAFSARGGTALDGVRYDPGATDYIDAVASLDVLTGAATEKYGAGSVGVYAVTFNEIGDIMTSAAEAPNLSRVRWFGSDGNTLDPSLTGMTPAARFAASVNMTGMIWGIPIADRDSSVVTRITDRLGREPDGSAIALYDTFWVVVQVLGETQADAEQARLVRALVHTLDTFNGASGDLTVNAAGDRELASYNIVEVIEGPSGSGWRNIAQIRKSPSGTGDEITPYPQFW